MGKKYFFVAIATLLVCSIISCSEEKLRAKKPVYISIPELLVSTTYNIEGTSHQKITTVWMEINNESVGAFEMPANIPVILKEGLNKITIYEGISMNGIGASRAIYDRLKPIEFELEYSPSNSGKADTIVLSEENRTTSYADFANIELLETFDNAGINFEPTDKSDTSIIQSKDPSTYFINPTNPSEPNGRCGIMYTTADRPYCEVATISQYNLPGGGSNVYLEMNYKSNIPITVGIFAETTSTIEQKTTLGINPRQDWNKIYVNLVTEVSSFPGDPKFKIFIAASHQSAVDTGYVYLDNIKLVY